MKSANTASAAREAGLQMIYALEMGGQDAQAIERWYIEAHPLDPEVRERAGALLDTAVARRQEMENLIDAHAHGWRLQRISVIDRSLLKLGLAELMHAPAPASEVVIQEVLRLAKRFSQPTALRFLHGLLEAIVRDLAPPEAASGI